MKRINPVLKPDSFGALPPLPSPNEQLLLTLAFIAPQFLPFSPLPSFTSVIVLRCFALPPACFTKYRLPSSFLACLPLLSSSVFVSLCGVCNPCCRYLCVLFLSVFLLWSSSPISFLVSEEQQQHLDLFVSFVGLYDLLTGLWTIDPYSLLL